MGGCGHRKRNVHRDPIVNCGRDHHDGYDVGRARCSRPGARRGSCHRLRALNPSTLRWLADRHRHRVRCHLGQMPRPRRWQCLRFSEDAERGVRAADEAGVARAVGERASLACRPTRLIRPIPFAGVARQRWFESIANRAVRLRARRREEHVADGAALQDVRSERPRADPRAAVAHLARPASFSSRTPDQRCRSHPPVRDHQNCQRRNHACHSYLVNGRGYGNGLDHGLSRRDFEQLVV